jgi:hypothetical protein
MRVFWIVPLVLGLVFSRPAAAVTAIDLFASPQISEPYTFYGPCYCAPQLAYATGFFAVTPGDTVNFGVLKIFPAWLYSHYGDPPVQYTFSLIANTDTSHPISYADPYGGNGVVTRDLTSYIIANDVNFIQFSWLGPYEYTSPIVLTAVPEPSTWAMLLIGAAGIGYMIHRRRSQALAAD